MPGAEPFSSEGSPEVGVLLCHGFTGTPQSMRSWAEHLAGEGFTVRLPLLPGHGTNWRDCNRTGWPDWYGAVDAAFTDLRARCRQVFVCGLSMGGTLALAPRRTPRDGHHRAGAGEPFGADRAQGRHAGPAARTAGPGVRGDRQRHRQAGRGELAYDKTPVRAFVSLRRLWRHVRNDLYKVSQPVLLFHSATDHVVEPISSQTVLDGISSIDVTEIVLQDSYHVATLDYDAEAIFEGSVAFVRRLSRAGTPS